MTDAFTEALQEVAEKTLDRQRNKKQKWVIDDALKLCDERHGMKHNLNAGIVDANECRATNARGKPKKDGSVTNGPMSINRGQSVLQQY